MIHYPTFISSDTVFPTGCIRQQVLSPIRYTLFNESANPIEVLWEVMEIIPPGKSATYSKTAGEELVAIAYTRKEDILTKEPKFYQGILLKGNGGVQFIPSRIPSDTITIGNQRRSPELVTWFYSTTLKQGDLSQRIQTPFQSASTIHIKQPHGRKDLNLAFGRSTKFGDVETIVYRGSKNQFHYNPETKELFVGTWPATSRTHASIISPDAYSNVFWEPETIITVNNQTDKEMDALAIGFGMSCIRGWYGIMPFVCEQKKLPPKGSVTLKAKGLINWPVVLSGHSMCDLGFNPNDLTPKAITYTVTDTTLKTIYDGGNCYPLIKTASDAICWVASKSRNLPSWLGGPVVDAIYTLMGVKC